jgi:cyclopropane fatty-acyl-phospholipid synthase-like methyltransferase
MFSNNDIERYYDLSEVHYRKFWGLEKSKSLHYGFWDDSTKNFHEALLNINKILSEEVNITADDHVLDAGCGIGGSCLWLAQNVGCKSVGISLSRKQVEQAKELAGTQKLDGLVTFFEKDYTSTGPDSSFDVVWAIESVCYIPDKSSFTREAYRLLKKGGRLIIADFFKMGNLQHDESALVKRWANGWAIEDYVTEEDFEQQLKETGFSNIRFRNVTASIMRSARRLYRAYFIGIIPAFLYRITHRRATSLSRNNVDTAYLQYKTLRKGLWKYGIVSAYKS